MVSHQTVKARCQAIDLGIISPAQDAGYSLRVLVQNSCDVFVRIS
jgi:hypothetical protein